jgi:predicted GTPase
MSTMSEQQAPIDHADQLWCSLERSYPFLRDVNPDIQEKRKQLQRKEVVISTFGRHNCGKSTLLNVILRNSLLPTSMDNETCIEIKIRHDGTIHPGPCKNSCTGNDCPRLEQEISNGGTVTMVQGAENIAEKLRQENRKCRQTGILNQSGHNCFVLYAFVEILQEAPEGWNLVLVDTPGFGEANIRHVTARTDTLFSTSTAYLYIIDSGSMGDDVDAKKIKLLYQHDKDLFKDNRFVVAVNKYDQRFLQGSLQRHNRTLGDKRQLGSAADIARNLRHKTRSFISESVKCEPLRDVEIVLVSAIWATTSLWLRADPHEDDVQCAKDILKSYPDPLPQGQGEVSPLDLASNLDSINGLPSLESKLKAMITNCIRIWRTSLAKAYTGYLEKARLALLDHHQRRTEERTRVGTTLALHANLNAKMDLLNGLAYVEGDQTPEIEFKLEEAYMRQDVETAKRFLHARIEDMTGNLIQVMKERIANTGKLFIQRDFEEEVKKFTKERAEPSLRAEQLNIKLEGVAGEFRKALEEMEALDREIETAAKKILKRGWTPSNNFLWEDRENRGDRDVLGDEVLQKQQLTLRDLHQQITAP